jgi:hypothetical protein
LLDTLTLNPVGGRTRREFLGAGAAGLAALKLTGCAAPRRSRGPGGVEPIPPHRALMLPGLHAYAERSVAAGETIRLRVSSAYPYELSIHQLGPEVDRPDADECLRAFPPAPPRVQPIHPGSYVHVERSLDDDPPIAALALECWVRPWRLSGSYQGLVTQHDYPAACGVGLFIDGERRIQFYAGDGGAFRNERMVAGPKLTQRSWHHIVGTWDGAAAALWVDGARVAQLPLTGPVRAGSAPLRLGAYGENGAADHFLDGDLAMPAIYGRALDAAEVAERFASKALTAPRADRLWACWMLSEERGSVVADATNHRRDGRIINHATWMIGGPSFDASAVPRYADYDPARDPTRGHGLRFASDDLYDCRWDVSHVFRIPRDARPGFYVARFRAEGEGAPRRHDVTFVVRRAPGRARAPLLVLAASNTWTAYGATAFAAHRTGPTFWGTEGIANSHPAAPAYCCYRDHHAGLPTYQIGLRVPWPSAGPDVRYSPDAVGYSHLMRAERFLLSWLERRKIAFDVISDQDLDRDPEALFGYRAVAISGHSEYWSIRMYEGLREYLRRGGNVVALSGNSIFWRVSFDEEGGVMECRKFDARIGGRPGAPVGELWHSHDGRRGSLMRECGYPAWALVGLECAGWAGTGRAEDFGVYVADRPDHFLFRGPEPVNVSAGETFGHGPGGVLPRAVGHEWDVRPATLLRMARGTPDGATAPVEPPGILTLARGILRGGAAVFDYFTADTALLDGVCAEMIYWERPDGGKVFHSGAIGTAWALEADPRLGALLRNVLHHFGV